MLLFLLGACWTAALALVLRPLFKAVRRIPNTPAVQPPGYAARQRLRRWRKSLARLAGWQYVVRISSCLAAAAAFENPEWRWMSARERGHLLYQMAELVAERAAEILKNMEGRGSLTVKIHGGKKYYRIPAEQKRENEQTC